MSMNAKHCCCIFTPSYERAVEKLEEIFVAKGRPENVKRKISRMDLRYYFDDEEWVWVRPFESARGYRAHKAWIDFGCDQRIVDEVILPCCCYSDDVNYF